MMIRFPHRGPIRAECESVRMSSDRFEHSGMDHRLKRSDKWERLLEDRERIAFMNIQFNSIRHLLGEGVSDLNRGSLLLMSL